MRKLTIYYKTRASGAPHSTLCLRDLDSVQSPCQATWPNHFHTTSLRKILGIKWQDKIPDTEVLARAGQVSQAYIQA